MDHEEIIYIGKGFGNRHKVSAKKRGGIPEIIETFVNEKKALEAEKQYIAKYNPPLNKTKGGEGMSRILTRRRLANEAAEEKRLETKFKTDCYKEADKGSLLALFAGLCYCRSDKNKEKFITYLKRLKAFPIPEHPIARMIWDSAQRIPFSCIETI
jgi:hypothetical protein